MTFLLFVQRIVCRGDQEFCEIWVRRGLSSSVIRRMQCRGFVIRLLGERLVEENSTD
jgi:hypothetical protein